MQAAGAGVIIRCLATKRVACNRCSVSSWSSLKRPILSLEETILMPHQRYRDRHALVTRGVEVPPAAPLVRPWPDERPGH